ncbi:bpX6 domain-containing protein [Pseudomonas putida]
MIEAGSVVRYPVLRGHQQVAGLWLPAQRFDPRQRQALLLSHWQAGARAWRFDSGDLLRWQQAQWLDCDALTGWPLVSLDGTLCSAPLQACERIGVPAADLWLVRDSRVEGLHLREATALLPGQWLALDDYVFIDTYDCTELLQPPPAPPLPGPEDVRQILGSAVGSPPAEQAQVLQALAQRQPAAAAKPVAQPVARGATGRGAGTGIAAVALLGAAVIKGFSGGGAPLPATPAPPAPSDILPALVLFSLFAVAGVWGGGWRNNGPLRRWVSRRAAARPAAAPAAPTIPARRQPQRFVPGFIDRWLTRLATASRLDKLFGKRQAAYLQNMLELFERGDLREALRHAIALDTPEPAKEKFSPFPQARKDLDLQPRGRPQGAIRLPKDFDGHLRALYRSTFTRLDREGRVDEAVFVLAQLLSVHQEALDYLEKHKRHAQAADLALAWDMPAAVIVRQLCLADDWLRALQVARRDRAFADAVKALQEKWPNEAARLRVEWAEYLAGQGRWLEAVDAIWPLAAERGRAQPWLLTAEAAGGPLAAGALVKRATLLPDTLAVYQPWLQAVCEDPAREPERSAMGYALLAVLPRRATPASTGLARLLFGELVQDRRMAPDRLKELAKLCDDPLLIADMPALDYVIASRVRWSNGPLFERAAPAAGLRPIVDAMVLPDLRVLVAVGESGVVLLDRFGQAQAHFAVPAQRLVMGSSGQVALALTRRESVWRVSKLELTGRTVQDLGALTMDHFAVEYDGTAWTIAHGRQVRVVDVEREFATLWHVADLPGQVQGVFTSTTQETLLIGAGGDTLERWCYRLPGRRLIARDPVASPTEQQMTPFLSMDGEPLAYGFVVEDDALALRVNHGQRDALYGLPGLDTNQSEHLRVVFWDECLGMIYPTPDGQQRVRFVTAYKDTAVVDLHWPSSATIQVRFAGSSWVVFDHEGRLVCLDLMGALPRLFSVG